MIVLDLWQFYDFNIICVRGLVLFIGDRLRSKTAYIYDHTTVSIFDN